MIVVLTGGTGGAKLIEGLAAETDPAELTIICNTGDDAIFHGLYVSPDIDTITYTLAGLTDSDRGWGIKDDTFNALDQLGRLGDDLTETNGWRADGDLVRRRAGCAAGARGTHSIHVGDERADCRIGPGDARHGRGDDRIGGRRGRRRP